MCPGDFILTHRDRFYSKLVSFGQRRRFKDANAMYAHWSHAALIENSSGCIIEALATGVCRNSIEEYRHVELHYVHVDMDNQDRKQAVAFARSCLGQRYGWSIILGLGFVLLTNSRLQVGFNGTEICSALVARALERGPFIFPKTPITMCPADLAAFFKIEP